MNGPRILLLGALLGGAAMVGIAVSVVQDHSRTDVRDDRPRASSPAGTPAPVPRRPVHDPASPDSQEAPVFVEPAIREDPTTSSDQPPAFLVHVRVVEQASGRAMPGAALELDRAEPGGRLRRAYAADLANWHGADVQYDEQFDWMADVSGARDDVLIADADGTALLEVPCGLAFELVAAPYVGSRARVRARVLPEGQGTQHELLLEVPSTGVIDGVVRTSEGTPVGGIEVVASHDRHTFLREKTAADGAFQFELPVGDWLLAAPRGAAPEHVWIPREVTLRPGDRQAVQLVVGLGTISGTVVQLPDQAVADAAVMIHEGPPTALHTRTAVDGTFTLGPLPQGLFSLEIERGSGTGLRLDGVAAGTRDLRIELPREILVQVGGVDSIRGQRVPVRVTARAAEPGPFTGARAASGEAHLASLHLVPGVYSFLVQSEVGIGQLRDVAVAEATVASPLEAVIHPASSLEVVAGPAVLDCELELQHESVDFSLRVPMRSLRPGDPLVLPAGRVTVTLWRGEDALHSFSDNLRAPRPGSPLPITRIAFGPD